MLEKVLSGLKKQAKSIVDFEKKEMIELTLEEQYRNDTKKSCFICKKRFFEDAKNNYIKVRDHCHYTENLEVQHIKYVIWCIILQEKYQLFYGSSYDNHFVKGLVEEFEGDFECLGENKEKYITFFVPI